MTREIATPKRILAVLVLLVMGPAVASAFDWPGWMPFVGKPDAPAHRAHPPIAGHAIPQYVPKKTSMFQQASTGTKRFFRGAGDVLMLRPREKHHSWAAPVSSHSIPEQHAPKTSTAKTLPASLPKSATESKFKLLTNWWKKDDPRKPPELPDDR